MTEPLSAKEYNQLSNSDHAAKVVQGALPKVMKELQQARAQESLNRIPDCIKRYNRSCGGNTYTKPDFDKLVESYFILKSKKTSEEEKYAAQKDALFKLGKIQLQCEAHPDLRLDCNKIMAAGYPKMWEPLRDQLLKDRKNKKVSEIFNEVYSPSLNPKMMALLVSPKKKDSTIVMQNFARVTRHYFAELENKKPNRVNVQQTIGQVKPEVKPQDTYYDITPILDKTQIYNLAEGEGELVLPKKLFTELNIKEDDEQVFTDSIAKIKDIWMLLNGQVAKDWTINKCDPAICAVIEKELQSRPKERIKVLAWIADPKNQFYVFLLVAPAAMKGVVKFKIQEQTYRSEQIDNTAVSAITYKDGDEEVNYDVTPVVDEFAKEDRSVKTDFETMKEAAENAGSDDEYDDYGWEDEGSFEDEGSDGSSSEEGSGEGSEETEEAEESEEKNFARNWYGRIRW